MSTGRSSNKHAKGLLSTLFVLLILIQLNVIFPFIGTVHAKKDVVFYPLGNYVEIDQNQIPTYFFEQGKYLRGYFEVHYHDDDFDAFGYNNFLSLKPPAMSSLPKPVKDNKLTALAMIQWDLFRVRISPLTDKKQTVTLKFYSQSKMNIDPYSIRCYIVGTGATKLDYQFTPFFPTSDATASTLGPWEGTLSLKNYVIGTSPSIQLVIYGSTEVNANLDTPVPITYPRDIVYTLPNYELHIMLPNATVLDPSTTVKPSIKVSNYDQAAVTLPDSYLLIDQYMVQEDNKQLYTLDEVRTVQLSSPLTVDKKNIDTYSLKCAYAFNDTDFKTFTIDPTSSAYITSVSETSYILSCNQFLTQPNYVMAIIGKAALFEPCTTASNCPISKNGKTLTSGTQIDVLFNPDTQLKGSFKVDEINNSDIKNVKSTPAKQGKLSPLYAFSFDFSLTTVDKSIANTVESQNVITVRMEGNLVDVDPYSLRIFKLNNAGDLFELVSDDIPKFGQSSFSFDATSLLSSGKAKIVVALFGYKETDATINELVYVHYPRTVHYNLDKYSTLDNYFIEVTPAITPYNKRPFYTLSNYSPSKVTGLEEFAVLYSFMQQNGDGLENIDYDNGRKFSIGFDAVLTDLITKKPINYKFKDLKCVYLFKETNFETVEVSEGKASFDTTRNRYTIDCFEDIRDENFVFMLITKPFSGMISHRSLDVPSMIDQNSIDVYSSLVLPEDTLKVYSNPNTRSRGTYMIKTDRGSYSDYSLPATEPALTLLGVYILDLSDVTVFSTQAFDTQFTLIYEKNTLDKNVDPYSYRFFSFDDQKKQFHYMQRGNESTKDPWVLSLDLSKAPSFIKFAVFAYNSDIGEQGRTYSIHYERSLLYTFPNDEILEFHFSSPAFPDTKLGYTFKMREIETHPILQELTIVNSFYIEETVDEAALIEKKFTYNDKTTDLNGEKIVNMQSLQCMYRLPGGSTYFAGLTYNHTPTEFTLACTEAFFTIEKYELIIVAEKSAIPIVPPEISDFVNPIPIVPVPSPKESKPSVEENDYDVAVIILAVLVAVLFVCVVSLSIWVLVQYTISKKRSSDASMLEMGYTKSDL